MRAHWENAECLPLISRATTAELALVLAYPKFQLPPDLQRELLAEYLPFCEVVIVKGSCTAVCRDPKDQPFLDLAQHGKAEILVSSDKDLLALTGKTRFAIETPEAYRRRMHP
jgi:uncharacterized protein